MCDRVSEARSIPAERPILGPFAAWSKASLVAIAEANNPRLRGFGCKGLGCKVWLQSLAAKPTGLFVRPLSLKRPTEDTGAAHFRFRSRRWRDLSLRRRRWHRQILALHRIHQFTIRGATDRRTIVDTCGRALGHQFRLRPRRRRNQENCKDEFLHWFFSCNALFNPY